MQRKLRNAAYPGSNRPEVEVDFTGKSFELIDKLTDENTTIVVFVAVHPYSQYIYAEGMWTAVD